MAYPYDLSLVRKTQGLLVQQMGSETLLYDERTHRAFCLSVLAAQVWHLLDQSATIAQIAEAATGALRRPVSHEMVLLALSEFRRDGLILDVATSLPLVLSSRRDMLQRFSAGAVMMVPLVAMVMAPKAAQAYNGCVNCQFSPGNTTRQREAQSAPAGDDQNVAPQPQHSDYQAVFVP